MAVEVRSLNAAPEVQSKVRMSLESGIRLLWVVYPYTRSVVVYEPLKKISTFTAEDTLGGGDVVPSFECKVSSTFE